MSVLLSGLIPDLLLWNGFLARPLSMRSLMEKLFRAYTLEWESSDDEQLLARSSREAGEQNGPRAKPRAKSTPIPPPPLEQGLLVASEPSVVSSGSDSAWLSSASRSGWEAHNSWGFSKVNEPPGESERSGTGYDVETKRVSMQSVMLVYSAAFTCIPMPP